MTEPNLNREPQRPGTYPRRVLIVVSGLSPQIVTETLFALAVAPGVSSRFVPTEVHLVTTEEGAHRATLTLLDPASGQFHSFCREFGLEGAIAFNGESIHVIRDSKDRALPDIRTADENVRAGDLITETVRSLTADPECAIHASIAGGRKTMGFYLGYALSLFGRTQDRLSHVLVSPEFEGNQNFYFPPVKPVVLFTHDNRPIRTNSAQITLAEIPFVRLRDGLPSALLEGSACFADTIAAAQRKVLPAKLDIDLGRKTVVCGGTAVAMQPLTLAWYAWFARRQREGKAPVRFTDAPPEEFLEVYERVVGPDSAYLERTRTEILGGFPREFWEQKLSRVTAALRKALGLHADLYEIAMSGRRPTSRYALRLLPAQIILRN